VALPHIALPVFPLPPLVVIQMADFPSKPSQEIGRCDGASAIQRDIGVVDARNAVARPRAFIRVWAHAADDEELGLGGDVAENRQPAGTRSESQAYAAVAFMAGWTRSES
jgi:hypothetical protein